MIHVYMHADSAQWLHYMYMAFYMIRKELRTVLLFAVDGAWGAWGQWGTCSVTCGGGQWSRTRICDNPTPANGGKTCPGSSGDFADCNTDACPTVAAGQYQQVKSITVEHA